MGSRGLALAVIVVTGALLLGPRGAAAVQAPGFTSEDVDGTQYTLSQLMAAHTATVLTFW